MAATDLSADLLLRPLDMLLKCNRICGDLAGGDRNTALEFIGGGMPEAHHPDAGFFLEEDPHGTDSSIHHEPAGGKEP